MTVPEKTQFSCLNKGSWCHFKRLKVAEQGFTSEQDTGPTGCSGAAVGDQVVYVTYCLHLGS